MRTHATAQLVGSRPRQCDATAVVAAPNGVCVYALLDGVGKSHKVARWTRGAAHRVAAQAAHHQHAEHGLRAAYRHYADNKPCVSPWEQAPAAAAVVAVTAPGKPLTIAWCGDARAYLHRDGALQQLTDDHNLRRVNGGRPNIVTSWLGSDATDTECLETVHHPAIESTTIDLTCPSVRLLLASDGAYEPLSQPDLRMANLLTGTPQDDARRLVSLATELAGPRADNATALIADLHHGTHY